MEKILTVDAGRPNQTVRGGRGRETQAKRPETSVAKIAELYRDQTPGREMEMQPLEEGG